MCTCVCACARALYITHRRSINDVKYHRLLKVFFITSERAVSCADHYHVSVHATVTGMHLYEMCMDFIRSLPLCMCVCVGGEPVCACVCGIQWLA